MEEFVYARHDGGFDVVMMSGGGLERLFSLAAIGKWVWVRLLGSQRTLCSLGYCQALHSVIGLLPDYSLLNMTKHDKTSITNLKEGTLIIPNYYDILSILTLPKRCNNSWPDSPRIDP